MTYESPLVWGIFAIIYFIWTLCLKYKNIELNQELNNLRHQNLDLINFTDQNMVMKDSEGKSQHPEYNSEEVEELYEQYWDIVISSPNDYAKTKSKK